MSEYKVLRVPSDIDWSLFSSQGMSAPHMVSTPLTSHVSDPSVFSNLTLPGPPPLSTQLIQRSPPTSLQSFVRQAAKDVLADFKPFIPPEEKEDSPNAEDEANEERLKELVGVGVTGIGKSKNGVGGRNGRRRVGSGLRLKHENEGNEMLAAGWGVKEREKGKGKDGKCERCVLCLFSFFLKMLTWSRSLTVPPKFASAPNASAGPPFVQTNSWGRVLLSQMALRHY